MCGMFINKCAFREDMFGMGFLVFCVIFSAVGLFLLLNKEPLRRWFLGVFLLSIVLKIIVILLVNVWLFGNVFEHPDSGFYMVESQKLADEGFLTKDIFVEKPTPEKLLTFFFAIFGRHVAFVELFNVILSSFGLLFLSLCAYRLFGAAASRICSLLILIDPALNYWAVQLLKEAITVFLVGFLMYVFISKNRWYDIFLFAAGFFMMHTFYRSYFAFILLLAMMAVSIFDVAWRRILTFAAIAVVFILVSISPTLSIFDVSVDSQSGETDFAQTAFSEQAVESSAFIALKSSPSRVARIITSVRQSNMASHHAFFDDSAVFVEFKSGLDVVKFFPLAMAYGFFLPFPWGAKSLYELLYSVSILWWYALIPFVLIGLFLSRRVKQSYVLSGYALGMFLFLSYFVVTIAPFVRWRLTALLALYPFASFALDRLTSMPRLDSKSVSILGTRGIPAKYGGFETFVERLGIGLLKKGFKVSVCCPKGEFTKKVYRGIRRVVVRDYSYYLGAAGTLLYDLHCLVRASFDDSRFVYVLGYSSSIFCVVPRMLGKTVLINMDGLEWKRSKWGAFARLYLSFSEWFATKVAAMVVVDSKVLVDYYDTTYCVDAKYAAYGADVCRTADKSFLEGIKVRANNYYLVIARLEPENNVDLIITGFLNSKSGKDLIIVGPANTPYGKSLRKSFECASVRFMGGIFDDRITDALRVYSFAYFHGHSVGGTNPSLLSAAGAGCTIIAHENLFNREVLGKSSSYFKSSEDVAQGITILEARAGKAVQNEAARLIVSKRYDWDQCAQLHVELFRLAWRKNG